MKNAGAIVLAGALITSTGLAQPQSQQPPVKTTAAGVLIDVSVVDSKGQPVLDLAPTDFELSDEGKRQQLISITLVNNGSTRPIDVATARQPASEMVAPSAGPLQTPATERTPTVTAIVFDKLSSDSAPYAVGAALACVSTLTPSHDYAGVFVADLNLRTLEPFTTDQARLRDAIERFGATARTNMRPETQRAGDELIRRMDPNTPPTAGAESPGGFASVAERERMLKAAQSDPALYRMIQLMWRMETTFRQLLTEYEGHSSIAGLRVVVDALSLAPGRKSVLYFTENLPITDRLKPKFEAIIGQANRANITFYPVDAAGLRLHSKEAEVARNVNLAGAQGIGDAQREDGAWTKELERQNQLMESRPTAVLGRLAKETGGFVIENTNNLGAGVARIQQERTTYYLLGYQPTNANMDGKFRRVSVKVKRPKVSVRARPGYLAVPQETR